MPAEPTLFLDQNRFVSVSFLPFLANDHLNPSGGVRPSTRPSVKRPDAHHNARKLSTIVMIMMRKARSNLSRAGGQKAFDEPPQFLHGLRPSLLTGDYLAPTLQNVIHVFDAVTPFLLAVTRAKFSH